VIAKRLASPSEKVQTAARSVARHLELRAFLELARREALDSGLAPAKRQAAIAALAGGSLAELRPIFEQMLDREKDPELLRTAIRALGSFEDPAVPEVLVSRWKGFGPAARTAVLDALLDRQSSIPPTLAAVEGGRIDASAFDLPRREKLLENPDADVAARARKLFGEAGGDRQASSTVIAPLSTSRGTWRAAVRCSKGIARSAICSGAAGASVRTCRGCRAARASSSWRTS
jgi:hypothetical protein